jgi:hypothetical protein
VTIKGKRLSSTKAFQARQTASEEKGQRLRSTLTAQAEHGQLWARMRQEGKHHESDIGLSAIQYQSTQCLSLSHHLWLVLSVHSVLSAPCRPQDARQQRPSATASSPSFLCDYRTVPTIQKLELELSSASRADESQSAVLLLCRSILQRQRSQELFKAIDNELTV